MTDKLRSYGVAHRELMPDVIHDTSQYANNRAEQSHEATRVRERGMRRFKSMGQAQRFLSAHAAVYNVFSHERHVVRGEHDRHHRTSAVGEWSWAGAWDHVIDFCDRETLTCQYRTWGYNCLSEQTGVFT